MNPDGMESNKFLHKLPLKAGAPTQAHGPKVQNAVLEPRPLPSFSSKVAYLQDRCNRYGDFFITRSIKLPDGSLKWTEWHSVLACWSASFKWPAADISRLEHADNMTSPAPIVIIDLDSPESISKVNDICDEMESKNVDHVCYSTGGKGFHIHAFYPELASIYKESRLVALKQKIIEHYGGEVSKASDRSMILIPFCPHRKNGIIKQV